MTYRPDFWSASCRHAMQESAGRLLTESERSMRSADAGPGGGHSWSQSVTPVDSHKLQEVSSPHAAVVQIDGAAVREGPRTARRHVHQ